MSTTKSSTTPEAFLVGLAPRLRGLLRMLVGTADDAEDLLQAAYVQFLTKGPDVSQPHAEMWIFKTARNLAFNHLRGNRRRQQRELQRPASQAEPDDPAVAADHRESMERIRECLGKLPLELREPLYLHVVDEFSLRQIAEQVQLGKSTVAARVQAGLVELNRCFQRGADEPA